jgi:cytochrome P450
LLNFTSAGHETAASTLTWAIYVLATRSDVQHKLSEEFRTLLDTDPDPGFTELNAQPYLNNFIREVLRFYSPSTFPALITLPPRAYHSYSC